MWQDHHGLAIALVCRKPEPANEVVFFVGCSYRRIEREPVVSQRKLRRRLVAKELLAAFDGSPVKSDDEILFTFSFFQALLSEGPGAAPFESIFERTAHPVRSAETKLVFPAKHPVPIILCNRMKK